MKPDSVILEPVMSQIIMSYFASMFNCDINLMMPALFSFVANLSFQNKSMRHIEETFSSFVRAILDKKKPQIRLLLLYQELHLRSPRHRKSNVHKTFRRSSRRILNVVYELS